MPKISNDGVLSIHDIEYLICHVAMLWRRLLSAKIKDLGISGTEKRILFCIARHPGWTQVKIANLLDLEPQNLMRSLDKLELRRLITKCADLTDRRAKCLFITPAAQKIIEQIHVMGDTIKPEILSNVADEKIHSLMEQLSIIRGNLLKELGE